MPDVWRHNFRTREMQKRVRRVMRARTLRDRRRRLAELDDAAGRMLRLPYVRDAIIDEMLAGQGPLPADSVPRESRARELILNCAECGDEFTSEQVRAHRDAVGSDVKDTALKAQIRQMIRRGEAVRLGRGRFRLVTGE